MLERNPVCNGIARSAQATLSDKALMGSLMNSAKCSRDLALHVALGRASAEDHCSYRIGTEACVKGALRVQLQQARPGQPAGKGHLCTGAEAGMLGISAYACSPSQWEHLVRNPI